MKTVKWILLAVFAVGVMAAAPTEAEAECLEVGWRGRDGNWLYYGAQVTDFDERRNRIRIKYDYRGGELELKIREKESPSGRDYVVLRGRWIERANNRSGAVRLEMTKGRHRAKGWYTYDDSGDGPKYDFVLRECGGRGGRR